MSEAFDPYYTWLGIPPDEQPPDHYRLLGIRRFETNHEVIANASDQRMTHLRTFQNGKRAAESQKLLNELSSATRCLLDPLLRQTYDASLRAKIEALQPLHPTSPLPQAQGVVPPLPAAIPQGLPQAVVQPNYHIPLPAAEPLPQAIPTAMQGQISIPGPLPLAPLALHARPGKSGHVAKRRVNTGLAIAVGLAGLVLLGGALVAVAGLAGVFSPAPNVVANPTPPSAAPKSVRLPIPVPAPMPPPSPNPRPTPTPESSPDSQGTPMAVRVASDSANVRQPAQDTRTYWEYSSLPGSETGVFRQISPGRWQERSGPRHFGFVEVERNPQFVELSDATRNTQVRLYDDHFAYNQTGRWVRGRSGGWKTNSGPANESPRLVIGQPIDLLALDWNAHKYGGNFTKKDGAWLTAGQNGNADRVQFPFEAPQEYTLDASFIRHSGDEAIVFVINFGGRQGSIVLNGFPTHGHRSGLQWIDGRQLPAITDPAPKRGPIVETGKEHRFHCEVTSDRIQATFDGDPLLDWNGPPERLSPDPFTRSPQPTHLALATWHASYEIKRCVLTPRKLAAGPSVVATNVPAKISVSGNQRPPPADQRRFLSFRGQGHFHLNRSDALLDTKQPFTLELWFRCLAEREDAILVDEKDLRLRLEAVKSGSAGIKKLHYRLGSMRGSSVVPEIGNAWHHVALSGDSAGVGCFYDGKKVAAAAHPSDAPVVKILRIGMGIDRSVPLHGELAEIRFSATRRYHDDFQPASFLPDQDSRYCVFFSRKGIEVQVNNGPPPSMGWGGTTFVAGDTSFPPASAPSSAPPGHNLSRSVAEGTNSPATTQPLAEREPLPADETLTEAKGRIEEAYGAQLKAATKPNDKARLSGELLQIATNEQEPAAAYALLSEARTLAVGAGNVEAALAAAHELERRFEGDRFARLGKLLTELSAKVAGEQRERLLAEAIDLIQAAAAAERFDVAEPMALLAFTLSGRGKDTEPKKQTKVLRDRVTELKNGYSASQTALETLKANANDASAHLAVGRYQALLRGDWVTGLPHLARSGEGKLASAAQAEQAAASGADQLAAAELWRAAAEGFKGEDRSAIQQHALDMYKRLAPSLSGLDQSTAERRITELEPLVAAADNSAGLAKVPTRSKPEPGLILRLLVIPTNAGAQTPLPTPYLAVMRDPSELFRLPISQSLLDYGSYQLRHVWAGQLILEEDADLMVELEDVNVRVGTQVVGGAATSRRRIHTVPWKKGTYSLLITSNDSTPYVRIFRADNGQNVLFHTQQDLQKELDKSTPLPKGGASKGVRIDK